jgi:hypothetical protein
MLLQLRMTAIAASTMLALCLAAAGQARAAATAVYDLDNPGNAPYRASIQNQSCKSNALCTFYFPTSGASNRLVVTRVSCGFGPVGPNVTPIQANLVNSGQAKDAPVMTNYMVIIFNGLDFSQNPPQSNYVISEQTTAIFLSNETPAIFVQLSDPTGSKSATFVTCSLVGYIARPQ